MSRGHGEVQRTILAALPRDGAPQERWIALHDLCGDGASPARVESYRRAAHKLAAEGLVETHESSRRIRHRWSYEIPNDEGQWDASAIRKQLIPYLKKHYPKHARRVWAYLLYPDHKILHVTLCQPMSKRDQQRMHAVETEYKHWWYSHTSVRSLRIRAVLSPEDAEVERERKQAQRAEYNRAVAEARTITEGSQ